jgi:hypothetical protein
MVSASLISTLRRIAVPPAVVEQEKCHFCNKVLPDDHRHIVDLAAMRFMCTCEMCMVVQAVRGNYTPLPQRYLNLVDFKMSDELWSDFLIPVNMAFFVLKSNQSGAVAFYPAPTGATESKLKMEPWNELQKCNPALHDLMPDLEALLVNRLDAANKYYMVPIDSCYKLIGMIRTSWKGIHGGREVDDIIRKFFIELEKKSVLCPN